MSTNRGKLDHADQPNLDPSDSLTSECGSSEEQEMENLEWIWTGYRTLGSRRRNYCHSTPHTRVERESMR